MVCEVIECEEDKAGGEPRNPMARNLQHLTASSHGVLEVGSGLGTVEANGGGDVFVKGEEEGQRTRRTLWDRWEEGGEEKGQGII